MGTQQASFDFFNIPPEKGKPEVAAVSKIQEISGVQEVSEVEKVSKIQEVSEVQEVSNVEEVSVVEKVLEVSEVGEEIQVDEAVRDIPFIVAATKVSATIKTGKKPTRGRIKLSEMDVLVDLVDVPDDELLFQKRYYSIGTVSEMFKVNISLIRFWENEFDILKPKKNGKGDRLFRPEDIKNLQLIYHLLREKKYTIEGAKDFLKKNKKAEESFTIIDSLKKMKAFLLDLKSNL